jgi:hypothetical protein
VRLDPQHQGGAIPESGTTYPKNPKVFLTLYWFRVSLGGPLDDIKNLPLVAAILASQQFLAAVIIIFGDIPTKFEAGMEKEEEERVSLIEEECLFKFRAI